MTNDDVTISTPLYCVVLLEGYSIEPLLRLLSKGKASNSKNWNSRNSKNSKKNSKKKMKYLVEETDHLSIPLPKKGKKGTFYQKKGNFQERFREKKISEKRYLDEKFALRVQSVPTPNHFIRRTFFFFLVKIPRKENHQKRGKNDSCFVFG